MEPAKMPFTKQPSNTAHLQFADAILEVWHRRHDLAALIMQAHRELAAEVSDVDPEVSAAALQIALDTGQANPDTPEFIDARMTMLDAVLRIWHRMPTDLENAIMTTVKEHAIVRGEDPLMALVVIDDVLSLARGSGEAHTETLERLKAAKASKDRNREQQARERVLERRHAV